MRYRDEFATSKSPRIRVMCVKALRWKHTFLCQGWECIFDPPKGGGVASSATKSVNILLRSKDGNASFGILLFRDDHLSSMIAAHIVI